MDGGAWWATIQVVAKESDMTEHAHTHTHIHTHIHTHMHTHTFLEKLSCTSYISSTFMLASGHPGLKIKISYYCTPYSSVQQSTQKHNLLYRMHT